MITIDGSQGEGGGQILRSALTLSAITGQPFRIENIRAGREKPGLMRQHLAAVRAAAEICGAETEGAEVGAARLSFAPGRLRGGDYAFAIGTAGSTTLVAQTVLPALALADAPSRVTILGGTHNMHAPPFDFLDRAFLPLLRRMGADVAATLKRPGFYPAGGGEIELAATPADALRPIEIAERGPLRGRRIEATVANLPFHIAEREAKAAAQRLGWAEDEARPLTAGEADGPGNVLTATLEYENVCEVFTGFGRQGVSAEQVAQSVAAEAARYLRGDAPIGPHLADQLLLPLALAGGGRFVTCAPTRHTLTNMEIVERFLDISIDAVRRAGDGDCWDVTVEGR